MPNVYVVRALSLGSVALVAAIQAKIAVTKAIVNQQTLIPQIIRDIADYSSLIPGLNSVQNFFIRLELRRLDGKIEITESLQEEMSNLGMTSRLQGLSTVSGFVPKRVLKQIFNRLDDTVNDTEISSHYTPQDIHPKL